ncbi:MAG: universal stress protein, partial [Myxococcales bacterium]|nr:universal stress protein [Myxococcales bacterium]
KSDSLWQAQDPRYGADEVLIIPGPEAVAEILTAAQKEIDRHTAAAAARGVKVDGKASEGAVHEEVLRHAKAIKADLIVMGTHGRTGITRWALGSVAERVMRQAEAPVLAIKGKDAEPAHGDAAFPPVRIVVAHDLSEPAHRALDAAKSLRGDTKIPIDVVHVFLDPWADYQTASTAFREQAEHRFEAYHAGLKTILDEQIGKVFGQDRAGVTVHLVRGRPVEALVEHVKKSGAGMICMGSSGKDAVERFLLGSVAQKLMQLSPSPVLVVH